MRNAGHYIQRIGQQNLLGAEIGVRAGENAVELLKYLPISTLLLVDPYKPYFDDAILLDEEEQNAYYEQMLVNVAPYADKISIVKEKSHVAAANIEERSLDFVYVDACHSYISVAKDLASWWPKIKSNGFLCGHDFWFPGVEMALHEFVASQANSITVFNDSDWLIIREN